MLGSGWGLKQEKRITNANLGGRQKITDSTEIWFYKYNSYTCYLSAMFDLEFAIFGTVCSFPLKCDKARGPFKLNISTSKLDGYCLLT